MKRFTLHTIARLGMAASFALAAAGAQAQAWPVKQIRLVVPFAAG